MEQPSEAFDPAHQSTRSALIRGALSLALFAAFLVAMALMIFNAPGGWSFGYGVLHLAIGFVSTVLGTIVARLGLKRNPKSVACWLGLVLNGLVCSFLFLTLFMK